MKVLVTGAAGGVGRYVLDALVPDVDVVAVDLVSGPAREGVQWVQGDMLDLESMAAVAKGCDVVIHLAGIPIYTPDANVRIAQTNILGTTTVLEACVRSEVGRFIHASSICATAFIFWSRRRTPAYFPIDESYQDLPDDLYGLSKLMDEQLADAYSRRYGVQATSFRMATVWVPDSPTTASELSALLTEEMDNDLEFLDLRWQYVDVRDVARAYRLAIEHDVGVGIYNLGAVDSPGGDWRVWVEDIYPDVPELRSPQKYLADPSLPLWSIEKTRADLGYEPKHTWREYATFTEAYKKYLERRTRSRTPRSSR